MPFAMLAERLEESRARRWHASSKMLFSQSPHVPRDLDHRPRRREAGALGRPAGRPDSLSSSMCTVCPQLSQIRKMQSWRQPGCWLAT